MNKKITLPLHLQELVKKANEQGITFTKKNYKITEFDCFDIFKIQEENKKIK